MVNKAVIPTIGVQFPRDGYRSSLHSCRAMHLLKEILKPSVLSIKPYNFCITIAFFLFYRLEKLFLLN